MLGNEQLAMEHAGPAPALIQIKPVYSMIPKSGHRFSEKACPRENGGHALSKS